MARIYRYAGHAAERLIRGWFSCGSTNVTAFFLGGGSVGQWKWYENVAVTKSLTCCQGVLFDRCCQNPILWGAMELLWMTRQHDSTERISPSQIFICNRLGENCTTYDVLTYNRTSCLVRQESVGREISRTGNSQHSWQSKSSRVIDRNKECFAANNSQIVSLCTTLVQYREKRDKPRVRVLVQVLFKNRWLPRNGFDFFGQRLHYLRTRFDCEFHRRRRIKDTENIVCSYDRWWSRKGNISGGENRFFSTVENIPRLHSWQKRMMNGRLGNHSI